MKYEGILVATSLGFEIARRKREGTVEDVGLQEVVLVNPEKL